MDRKIGFYWVMIDNEWEVMRYNGKDLWYRLYPLQDVNYYTNQLSTIGDYIPEPNHEIPCKYPNLRKAIQERKEFIVKVTPEQSKEVQEIAFECCVWWSGRAANKTIINQDKVAISFDKWSTDSYNMTYYTNPIDSENPQFHLATDSLTAPLPEWVKVGAKCFAMFGISEELCTIDAIKDNRISVSNDKHEGNFTAESITAAKRQVDFEYLAKLMPFAVKSKNTGFIYSVDKVSPSEIYIALGNGVCDCTNISREFLIKSATETEFHEAGEWVKYET